MLGVGLLYIVTGSLNLVDIAERIGPAFEDQSRPIMAALAFILVGISLKLALFPLHVWLPNAYAFAPSFATIFLAATATKVAVYILLRLYFSVFGAAISLSQLPVTEVLLVLSLAAMFIASILAVYEDSIERMLAYSSVPRSATSRGIAIANQTGLTGTIVHILNHAVMKATLFAAIGAVVYRIGTSRISELGGLGQKMPLTMGAFVIGGLSMIGVPGTAGFVSKWYLGRRRHARGRALVAGRVPDRGRELGDLRDLYRPRRRGGLVPEPTGQRETANAAHERRSSMLVPILRARRRDRLFRPRDRLTWTGMAGKAAASIARRIEAMTGLQPSAPDRLLRC